MTASDIINAICYLSTVIVPVAMLAMRTVKKQKFVLRAALCISGLIAVITVSTVLIGLIDVNRYADYLIWAHTAKYLLIFMLSAVCVKICFVCDWWGALFCANAGYCVQHISARMGSIFDDFLLKESYLVYRVHWAVATLISMLVAAVIFIVYYLIFVRKIRKNSVFELTNKSQILISTLVVGITVVYNSFGISYASGSIMQAEQDGTSIIFGYGSLMFVYVSSMLIAFLVFMLNTGIRDNKMLSGEMDELKRLLDEGKRQYESEKRNIELINIKCHDLKHQLGAMKGKLYEEQIDEFKEIIEIYDSSVKVGNEALDVVLTQKSLYCSQHGIRLTCLLNGANYDFIPRHELYALFNNIIDNAIEAVEKLSEEKRIISITERAAGGFLSVRAENYYSGEIEFEGGLPVSANSGTEHGLGIKSMKLIAEKYGGGVTVSTESDKFILDVYFLENSQ